MNYNKIIGIDVGKTGAVAVIENNTIVNVIDTPLIGKYYDERKMAKIIKEYPSVPVWIEKATAMPKQGVCSMFTFGKGFGIWLGILASLDMSYSEVSPITWKKELCRDMPKEKGVSIIIAKRLFVNANDWLTLKKHHGRADAILIAEYGRRTMKRQTRRGE